MKIFTPATSANLSPGFDSLGLALQLYNEVCITPSPMQIISIKGQNAHKTHLKTNNPFVSIFYDIFNSLTKEKHYFKFEFTNNIPFSRGLGSSSAMIVSAVASAYKLAGIRIDKKTILDRSLCYEKHPDNLAPAVYGGFTVSIVHGNKVITKQKTLPPDIEAVIVIPNKPMSTQKSRTLLPKQYKTSDVVWNISHSSFLTAAFMSEDWNMLKDGGKDALHEERRMKQLPILFDVREVSYKNGSLLSTLSGSGSTFFNLCYKKDVPKLLNALKKEFSEFEILSFKFDNNGFFIHNS